MKISIKLVMLFLRFTFLLCILVNCENAPQNQSPHFKDKNGIATRPDTELYFKNVRQIFYQKKQFSTHEDFFTFLKFSEKQPYKLVIWQNWQKSKVNLEITGELQGKNIFIMEENNQPKKILVDVKKDNAYFVVALEIYKAILTDKAVFFEEDNKKNFFLTQADKEAWRVTFKDFLALVGRENMLK